MLRFSTSESDPVLLTPELTRPSVYLDYCVIVDLARDPARGPAFRETLLEKGGTLYLSWAHLVELFGLGVGPTYERIRAYLGSFGRNFVLIDNVANAVIDREARWQFGRQNPAIAEEFLVEWAAAWEGRSDPDMATLLDVMTRDPALLPKYQRLHRDNKEKLKRTFDEARAVYRSDREVKDRLDERRYSYAPGTPPTAYIYSQMIRECVITNDAFTEQDGLDFHHCIVSGAYCDFVVLDKKWTRRCRTIAWPPQAARVFSIVELDEFLEALRAWAPPEG